MQDPSPQGPQNATAPYMEDHTSATTTPPAGTLQDDSDVRRLPTVYFLRYPTTVPRDSGENDDFDALTHERRPSL